MITLRPLPYTYDALEPYISARIMELHHDKHQQAYVDNLNKALESHAELQKKSPEALILSLDSIPQDIRTAVRNNAGGDVNHAFFWECMKKNGVQSPRDEIKRMMQTHFEGIDGFKSKFEAAAKSVFGSGWAWLCLDQNGKPAIVTTPNQDTPLSQGMKPLLGLDVWEHAYYLQYENRRPDYIKAWWNIVDWNTVEERYEKVMK